MKCPYCGSGTHVYDTRQKPNGVVRRRECLSKSCRQRFVTLETIAFVGRQRRGPKRKKGRGRA